MFWVFYFIYLFFFTFSLICIRFYPLNLSDWFKYSDDDWFPEIIFLLTASWGNLVSPSTLDPRASCSASPVWRGCPPRPPGCLGSDMRVRRGRCCLCCVLTQLCPPRCPHWESDRCLTAETGCHLRANRQTWWWEYKISIPMFLRPAVLEISGIFKTSRRVCAVPFFLDFDVNKSLNLPAFVHWSKIHIKSSADRCLRVRL